MERHAGKYLVTVADDFGASASVNAAIAEAFDNGIITAASLMAGGRAFDGAVRIARERRALSVGLHVTLCDGMAALAHRDIPDIADANGAFEKNPARAWMKYRGSGVLKQAEREICAQFDRLEAAGIRPTHVDGHHHLHMHPAIFKMVCGQAAKRGVSWIRLPNEPLSAVLSLRSSRRGLMPFVEWAVFGVLGAVNSRKAAGYGLRAAKRVYGLSRTGMVDEGYLMSVLDRGDAGIEVFAHPDTATASGRGELSALTSPSVKKRLASLGVTLTGYRELCAAAPNPERP